MTRHSKNNTNAPVFSNTERAQLRGVYGTRMAQVEAGSQSPYDSCSLCLKTAVIAVICDHGHLFCKECILEYLLQEKQRLREGKQKKEERIEQNLKRSRTEQEARILEEVESFKAQNAIVPSRNEVKEAKIFSAIHSLSITENYETKRSLYCPLGDHQISPKRLYSVKLTNECTICRQTFRSGSEIITNLPCGDLCCKQCKTKDPYCPVCGNALTKTIKICIEKKTTVKEFLSPAPLFS